ncbi:MAG: ABC transporter ATP-binding protein [Niveispirillum sp.]|nr:ABC transporter ATP-binding protein [Niveispirillum sp.]
MQLATAIPTTTIRRLLNMLTASYGRRLMLTLGLGLSASLAEGAGLLLLVPVLERVGLGNGGSHAPGSLLWGLGLYLLLVLAAAGVTAARAIVSNHERNHFIDGLRGDLHKALLHVSWPVFQSLRATDVKQILMIEVNRLGMCHDALVNLGVAALTLPVLLGAALLLSPPLTLVTLAASLLALLLIRRIGRSGFDIGMRAGWAQQAMLADLTDDLAGLRVIKGLGAEQRRQEALVRRFTDLRQLQARHAAILAYEQAALMLTAAGLAALAVATATLWLEQPLSEALVVILAFARLAQRGLGSLRVWRQLETGLPAISLYTQMYDRLRAGAEPQTGLDLPAFTREMLLCGVSLRMPDGRMALDGLDLVLQANILLAVTGPSGAGKSSLTDLVSGLTVPTTGTISVDGTILTPDLLPAWRRQVAVVPQDPFLFHDTIRANLLLAAPTATEADLWTALEDAAAADFVRTLPQGLDTIVGDRGGAVSGGERQRLAIARALLRHPRLLILDEATSALDGGSEALVLETLNRLRGQVTVLAVTHREATRRAADQVLELDAGRVRVNLPARL